MDKRYVQYLCPIVRFSGITAAILDPVKTTLRDIQIKLLTLLPNDAVLVGHSINKDLEALQVRGHANKSNSRTSAPKQKVCGI